MTRFGDLDPPPTSLDTPSRPSTGGAAAHMADSAPLGTSDSAQHPLNGAPISPLGLYQGGRSPCRRQRSVRDQPAIVSLPARADRLRDPRHPPRPPRSVPARPLRARTHSRERTTGFGFSDSGTGLDFGISKLGWRPRATWPGLPGNEEAVSQGSPL